MESQVITKLSVWAEVRLASFDEHILDKKYRPRAIKGLEAWKSSQKHRLTSFDNVVIDNRIKRAKSMKN